MKKRRTGCHPQASLHQRFELSYKKDVECWEWIGVLGLDGYGQIRYRKRCYHAHRIAAMIFLDFDLDSRLLVCHKCDNPRCVNPSHLFIGTQSDNIRDCYKKGRGTDNRGERSGNAKLQDEDILKARAMYRDGETNTAIASRFNISRRQMRDILNRKAWSHICPR